MKHLELAYEAVLRANPDIHLILQMKAFLFQRWSLLLNVRFVVNCFLNALQLLEMRHLPLFYVCLWENSIVNVMYIICFINVQHICELTSLWYMSWYVSSTLMSHHLLFKIVCKFIFNWCHQIAWYAPHFAPYYAPDIMNSICSLTDVKIALKCLSNNYKLSKFLLR